MYVTIPTDYQSYEPQSTLPTHANRELDRTFKPGAFLFRESDDVQSIYEVKKGVLRLTRLLEDGRRQVIAFGFPGDIIGFPANGRHHTDCEALTRTTVKSRRLAALETGDGDPVLHRHLLDAALHEISAMQDHFMMLGRKSASERVASFLCALTERVGIQVGANREVELPMSRADIADFLGLTTETVSRTLTQLRRRKVIAIENVHKVIVLDPRALLSTARGDH
jgi:CRP-like cAMP-binding protein